MVHGTEKQFPCDIFPENESSIASDADPLGSPESRESDSGEIDMDLWSS